jgi:hypothetical protein
MTEIFEAVAPADGTAGPRKILVRSCNGVGKTTALFVCVAPNLQARCGNPPNLKVRRYTGQQFDFCGVAEKCCILDGEMMSTIGEIMKYEV